MGLYLVFKTPMFSRASLQLPSSLASSLTRSYKLDFRSVCFKISYYGQAVVAHAFNPSPWEAEAGGSLQAWPTQQVLGRWSI